MADPSGLGESALGFAASHEQTVDDFVERLRGLCGRATLEFALRVGQLVIDMFFGGDLARWRMRGRNDPSLRQLARRSDLPIGVSRLYRCIAIYEASCRLPRTCTWKNLGASHLRAVLGLPPAEQQRLLTAAEHENWTIARIESEVRLLRGDRPRRGRPRLSEGSKRVLSIQRWIDDWPEASNSAEFVGLDRETRAALHSRVLWVRDRCVELEALLRLDTSKSDDSRASLTSAE